MPEMQPIGNALVAVLMYITVFLLPRDLIFWTIFGGIIFVCIWYAKKGMGSWLNFVPRKGRILKSIRIGLTIITGSVILLKMFTEILGKPVFTNLDQINGLITAFLGIIIFVSFVEIQRG